MEEIDYNKIAIPVLGIFGVIFTFLIFFISSDYYVKKEYLDFKNLKFNAVLISKKDEHPTRGNEIYLKNGPKLNIHRQLFDILKIGDSIIKIKNSDSIYFHTSIGIIVDDYNEFQRGKYIKSLE